MVYVYPRILFNFACFSWVESVHCSFSFNIFIRRLKIMISMIIEFIFIGGTRNLILGNPPEQQYGWWCSITVYDIWSPSPFILVPPPRHLVSVGHVNLTHWNKGMGVQNWREGGGGRNPLLWLSPSFAHTPWIFRISRERALSLTSAIEKETNGGRKKKKYVVSEVMMAKEAPPPPFPSQLY